MTRYLDLFWTDPTKSLWNTVLKIVFICAQFYIVYLMLTEFKPTHDPNQDTFKVEYLVGGAFVLAILLPYRYTMGEVRLKTKQEQAGGEMRKPVVERLDNGREGFDSDMG